MSNPEDPDFKYEDSPDLWLFTSLTAGSSHIITATSRMETILKANRIPFKATDCATDEKARRLWSRRSQGKKLPGLVKEGWVLGDIEAIEEWNEYGELKQNLGPATAPTGAPNTQPASKENAVPVTPASKTTTMPIRTKEQQPDPAESGPQRSQASMLATEAAAAATARKAAPKPGVDASKIKPLSSEITPPEAKSKDTATDDVEQDAETAANTAANTQPQSQNPQEADATSGAVRSPSATVSHPTVPNLVADAGPKAAELSKSPEAKAELENTGLLNKRAEELENAELPKGAASKDPESILEANIITSSSSAGPAGTSGEAAVTHDTAAKDASTASPAASQKQHRHSSVSEAPAEVIAQVESENSIAEEEEEPATTATSGSKAEGKEHGGESPEQELKQSVSAKDAEAASESVDD